MGTMELIYIQYFEPITKQQEQWRNLCNMGWKKHVFLLTYKKCFAPTVVLVFMKNGAVSSKQS